MYRINTAAGEAMSRKGHACYPEDFPHLRPGQDFVAWKSGEDWERGGRALRISSGLGPGGL